MLTLKNDMRIDIAVYSGDGMNQAKQTGYGEANITTNYPNTYPYRNLWIAEIQILLY